MYKNKISAVYQIINTETGDRYVGSSKNVMKRWTEHKCHSTWKARPSSPLYQDMQKYGVENFRFQILTPVMKEYLKQVEQEFIDMLHPIYNDINANGWDFERQEETQKMYRQSEKGKESHRKSNKKYLHQPCFYNGETLTLKALLRRFERAGVEHPYSEAKKFLLNNNN